jgi:hypothetical protein
LTGNIFYGCETFGMTAYIRCSRNRVVYRNLLMYVILSDSTWEMILERIVRILLDIVVLIGFILVGYIDLWVYGQIESLVGQKRAKIRDFFTMSFVSYSNVLDEIHYEDLHG